MPFWRRSRGIRRPNGLPLRSRALAGSHVRYSPPPNVTEPAGRRLSGMLMLIIRRGAIPSLLAWAVFCAVVARVIGPIRALVLFVAVVAIVAVVIGGFVLFLF